MDRSSKSDDINQSINRSISKNHSTETDNKNVLKPSRRRFDDILDYIKDKYGLPDQTWTNKQYRILDADVSRRFSILPYFEHGRIEFALRSKSPFTINKENENKLVFATPEIWDWVMAKYGKANTNWDEEKASMVADDIWRTFYEKTESKQETGNNEDTTSPSSSSESLSFTDLEFSSTSELESPTTTKLESSNKEDDSDDSDEEFSSSSAEWVTCTPVSKKKGFSYEFDQDDTDEEEEYDNDDSEDETWTPKTIGTTSKPRISPNKKGAPSSSSPLTNEKVVKRKRGEPVRNCILGLPSSNTREMIRNNLFGVRKKDDKKDVTENKENKEQVNKGKQKMGD